jgi:hypothetical protein
MLSSHGTPLFLAIVLRQATSRVGCGAYIERCRALGGAQKVTAVKSRYGL